MQSWGALLATFTTSLLLCASLAQGGGDTSPKQLRDGKLAYFLHVHKSGGTSVCKLARLNGEHSSGKTNCNVYRLASHSEHVQNANHHNTSCCGSTVAVQAQFAAKTDWTFIANERDMPPELDHEHYKYMTVVRDPLKRHVSNYFYTMNIHSERKDSTKSFLQWYEHQADNYFLRKICGLACRVPRGSLNQTHLDIALRMLDQFDAVVVIDDALFSFSNMSVVLKDEIGWGTSAAVHTQRRKSQLDSLAKKLAKAGAAKYEYMNTFDDELYAYARVLAAQQREAHEGKDLNGGSTTTALSDAAKENLERVREEEVSSGRRAAYSALEGKCNNSCCGKCSKGCLDKVYMRP